jgi:two-component system, sensor histidine kinase and response regulator
VVDPNAAHPVDVRRLRAALTDLGAGAVFRELLGVFLKETPERLATLRQAVTAKDAQRVRFVAHTMKGSCGYLGANGLLALCRELEGLGRSGVLAEAAPLLARIEAEFKVVQGALEEELRA